MLTKHVINMTEIQRPYGGSLINPEVAPHVAVVLGSNTGSVCTGTLIALDIVLTLARCLFANYEQQEFADSMKVLVGVTKFVNVSNQKMVQERPVKEIFIHPNFKLSLEEPSFGYNDIALLLMSEKFHETEAVKATAVGDMDWDKTPVVQCNMAGFGTVNPMSDSADDDHLKMHEGPGPCVGSAGSGLVCDGKLVGFNVGIIPFKDISQCIYMHSTMVTCENTHSLAIILDLCPFLRWIHFVFPEIPEGPINCSRAAQLHATQFGFFIVFCILFWKQK